MKNCDILVTGDRSWMGERMLMQDHHLPEVDLLIRTSGEMRLSNFLLYQCAYAEFVFPTVLWPDFDINAYHAALSAFTNRDRRFGGRNK